LKDLRWVQFPLALLVFRFETSPYIAHSPYFIGIGI
jgi:hypothetical protein